MPEIKDITQEITKAVRDAAYDASEEARATVAAMRDVSATVH